MENLRNKSKTVWCTTDVSNQSPTCADTDEKLVDEFQSPSLFEDLPETNAVDEHRHHHHHESLVTERLNNSSSSALRLQYKELIREQDELKRINDSYKQELLLCKNHIKQLTVENNKLKDENIALRDRVDESVLQSNEFNEDCLLEVFSYLSMNDMIQVKRVCKKWYQASQQWFKQVQLLVHRVDGLVSPGTKVQLYKKYYKDKVYEKNDIYGYNEIISILHSCGPYIKYFKAEIFIDKRSVTEECEKFIFQWVPQLCRNIVNVELTGRFNLYAREMELNFESMVKHWEKLEKIEIRYLSVADNENFRKLLRNNNQLKTLKVLCFGSHVCGLINDNFFTCLPKTIEEISIRNMVIDDSEQLRNFLLTRKNFTSLQSLEFGGIIYFSDALATAIANIRSLTHLSLRSFHRYESRNTIDKIANLKSLKSLYLIENDELLEDNIINIVNSCTQLEALLILSYITLTDKTLDAIAKLKELKCLAIYMNNVPNDVNIKSNINWCDRLEVLWINGLEMNNSDALKLFRKASNLRYVIFAGCCDLSKDILQEANKIANERKNNILLIEAYSGNFDVDKAFNDGDPEDIDTPYFKYVKNGKVPLQIFPNDIENYVKDMISIFNIMLF